MKTDIDYGEVFPLRGVMSGEEYKEDHVL